MKYEWDESKRLANIEKHGLDFIDAWKVYEAQSRLDVVSYKSGEERTVSTAYVNEDLLILTLVHVPRDDAVRCISFRRASLKERSLYNEWQNRLNDE